jgi:hypothetical protein
LIFRGDFLSLRSYQNIIEEKLPLHNIRVFKQHLMSSVVLRLLSVVNLFFLRTHGLPAPVPTEGGAGRRTQNSELSILLSALSFQFLIILLSAICILLTAFLTDSTGSSPRL